MLERVERRERVQIKVGYLVQKRVVDVLGKQRHLSGPVIRRLGRGGAGRLVYVIHGQLVQQLIRAFHDIAGQAGDPRHVNSVASIGRAGHDAV